MHISGLSNHKKNILFCSHLESIDVQITPQKLYWILRCPLSIKQIEKSTVEILIFCVCMWGGVEGWGIGGKHPLVQYSSISIILFKALQN